VALASPASAQWGAPGTTTPNNPETPEPATEQSCTEALGHLRRVYASELVPVAESHKVWVTPICMDEDSVFRTAGNAGTLRMAIASNPATRKALQVKNFHPEDVVGVRMTARDVVILYVHPFHRR
jgi:hypothetical protein